MGASILLVIALSGLTQVRGDYRERFYTGACDREGVPLWEDRPVGGKRLFVRVAGEAPAPALAEAVTGEDGTFATSFQPPATLGDRDVEGVRIGTTEWHPPSYPCRVHPYTGSSPP